MSKVLKLGADPVFGIKESSNKAVMLDSYTTDISSKSVEITNGNGAKIGEVMYDQNVTYNYTGTLMNSGEAVCFPRIGEHDTIAAAIGVQNELINSNLPYDCDGQSIVKNISVSYNAGQVAKITVSGEHAFPGTSKA